MPARAAAPLLLCLAGRELGGERLSSPAVSVNKVPQPGRGRQVLCAPKPSTRWLL